MLDAAKKVPSTEALAMRLQSEQLQHRLSTDKDPATVFTLFKLDRIGRDKLWASPQFSTYIKYADNFFVKNPNKRVTTIGVVRLKYGDDGLLTMIIAAEKEPGMQKIAKRVEQELFQAWKADLRTPDEAFENRRLGNVGDSLLESPLFGYYTRFLNDYNNVHAGKEATMISALTTHYDDEALTSMLVASKKVPSTEKLATKLQDDQIKFWLAEKNPIVKPDELFKSLRLDESVDDLLTSPFLDTWASYLNAYNAKYPPGDNVLMTDIFRAAFGDQDLIRMLIKVKEVSSTKKIATSLQASLLKQWVLDRAPPENLAKVLKAGGVADDVSADILAAYTTKFKDING
ncbi:suppressor of RNA silencing [Phytophthora cinnamomi]|uniref:suppressor of RNA silencing n=1 Tax=Phytophthora cinnamomi TaxID=4785 RepID=UPI003559D301|nr:suppressor of RNA silencing [Phytophthora cinnamomi]